MRDMRALIRRLADGGMTVLLSSHLLAEVEELCNRVAIVRSGAMVYEGAIADLKRTSASGYRLRTTDDARAFEVCRGRPGLSDLRHASGGIHFGAGDETAAALSVALVEAGVAIVELARETATLEDLFFKLTEGEPAAEPQPVPA
jgi:ABC-2 type transport system ATP-binding protein